jgi:DNA-nicking Smr family endonuclease
MEVGEAQARPAKVLEGGLVAPGDAVTLEAVALPMTDVLDLHSFRPEDVPGVVSGYLEEARRGGILEVRIVHGRGRGVQRAVVRRLLADAPGVVGFADASPDRGGWGATLVRLSPPERAPAE